MRTQSERVRWVFCAAALTLVTAAHAQHKTYKCVTGGRTVYQQTACAAAAQAFEPGAAASTAAAKAPGRGAQAPAGAASAPVKARP